MRLPTIRGVIDRRILVNYCVAPEILVRLLPAPFRPKLVAGWGMAGICLIRLKQLRPAFWPSLMGFSSENAAHRIAVEWEDKDGVREGVYVRRRDTNSWLAQHVGGTLFPGFHHAARFTTEETDDRLQVALRSIDGATRVFVKGHRTNSLPASSVFASLEEASAFFQAGSLGYSDTPEPGRYQGLSLNCQTWSVEPLEVEEVHSSLFDDEERFPKGSIAFDNALLMRGIAHEWISRADLCCQDAAQMLASSGT